jgi:hypothetical protein
MDLRIPYTFYPIALPHWIAWVFFSAALLGAVATGVIGARRGGWARCMISKTHGLSADVLSA